MLPDEPHKHHPCDPANAVLETDQIWRFSKKVFNRKIRRPSHSNRWDKYIGDYFLLELILASSMHLTNLFIWVSANINAFTVCDAQK